MTKAALPAYMDKHLASQDIPPGHCFGLYFPVWQDDWSKVSEKTAALKNATSLPNASLKMAEALRQRQQIIALQNDALGYFPAVSTSPFMTGIGNEHPLENGFAFLNPYGLPYLPGSSVKGVLRTAAEELALGLYGDTEGWDMLSVWWLFGFEAGLAAISTKPYKGDTVLVEEAKRRRDKYQAWVTKGDYDQDSLERFIKATVAKKDQKRYLDQPQQFLLSLSDDLSNQGTLCFWDVYPQSKSLAMDILTPHHGDYFQGKNAPHDSEKPNPNVFLTVPPGSQFDFYCTCTTERLPKVLQQNWQPLLQAAFAYAFDWLGFGAKTAVGYGQMRKDENAEQALNDQKNQHQLKMEADAKQKEAEKRLADLPPFERDIEQLLKANKDPNKKDYLILLDAVKTGRWQDDDKQSVLDRIKLLMQQAGDWKPTTQKKNPSKDREHQHTLEVLKLLEQ